MRCWCDRVWCRKGRRVSRAARGYSGIRPRDRTTLNEIVALASVVLSIGTNIGLYIHLSSTMNTRFDSVDRKFDSIERRLELIQGDTHQMDIRLTKLEK
jgi:hypothetical protein